MTEAILFDMDGVLLKGRGTHSDVYRAAAGDALAELGIEAPLDSAAEILGAARYDESMDDACRDLGIDRDEFWAARERHASRRTNDRVRSGEREPFADVAALADLAADARLGIVSNNRQATVDYVASEVVPRGTVDVAIGRQPTVESYRRRKPEPDFIETAIERLGVNDALYVGDRETDLVAAERAGVAGAFVRRPHNDDLALDREPFVTVESLTEL